MNSMTGYGRATAALGELTVTVQVNSVNRRGLDLSQKLPAEWEAFEPAVSEAVRKVAMRGKVHVAVEVTGRSSAAPAWDEASLAATLRQLEKVAQASGVKFAPTTELLWQIASAQRTTAQLPADEAAGQRHGCPDGRPHHIHGLVPFRSIRSTWPRIRGPKLMCTQRPNSSISWSN